MVMFRSFRVAGFVFCALMMISPGISAEGATDSVRHMGAPSSMDIRMIANNGSVAVEELRGAAALAHMQNLRSRRPAAFAKVAMSLRARGFVPTDIVYVQRTVRLASGGSGGSIAPQFASYSESNSEGEITLWSWDDGDDRTWEGSIYVEKYGGESAMAEGQLDVSTESWSWYYTDVVWESGPISPEYQDVRRQLSPRAEALQQPAAAAVTTPFNPPLTVYMFAQEGGGRDWIQFFKDYRACVVGWCTGATVACLVSGPKWPLCWGGACVGAQIGCFIDNYW
jgi:hypothetical protein